MNMNIPIPSASVRQTALASVASFSFHSATRAQVTNFDVGAFATQDPAMKTVKHSDLEPKQIRE
jgi:hypothetical protein